MTTRAQIQAIIAETQTALGQMCSLYQFRGCNLSGAEGGTILGTLNTDYTLPTIADASYFAGKGMNLFRMPFRWERIQPVLGGPLDPAHVAWLQGVVAANLGTIVLDVHNYGLYGPNLIGSAAGPTNAQFAELWGALAGLFPNNPNIQFGLMNEPSAISLASWLVTCNAAIAAIRGAGGTGTILIPGANNSTGAWTWLPSGNASMLGNSIVDPLNNYAFELHQYPDSNGSGTGPAISATVYQDRLSAATTWARLNGKRLFLGEFGVANDATSCAAGANGAAFMAQNADVWASWAAWGGGPWWPPSYIYRIEPTGGVDSPQMTALLPYL